MSKFYKVYNIPDNYWKRMIYRLSKDHIITEFYTKTETKYKTPIGLISIQNYHSPNCGRINGGTYNESISNSI